MNTKQTNPHRGGTLDDFLTGTGDLEAVTEAATKVVLALELAELMATKRISKAKELTQRTDTSRSSPERLPNSGNAVVTSADDTGDTVEPSPIPRP